MDSKPVLVECEKLLRLIEPSLNGFGCYLIDWQEIASIEPKLERKGSLAWTSFLLPATMRPWLESQGRWVGDGFATVMHMELEPMKHLANVFGVACHELAHWLTDDRVASPDDHPALVQAYANELRDWGNIDCVDVEFDPPWLMHDDRFVRAATHLSLRAGEVIEEVTPRRVRFCWGLSFMVNENTFAVSLADEFEQVGSKCSIREILATDPPQTFVDEWTVATSDKVLFREDLRNASSK